MNRQILCFDYLLVSFYIPQTELENMTSKMPGCHHGGFALYKLMVEAQKDI